MNTWNPRANDLFLSALDVADMADRRRFLDEACGADRPLREQVEVLLAATARAGSFLEHPAAPPLDPGTLPHNPAAAPAGPDEAVGAVLAGRYKLVEAIGDGGMGKVFLAQQTEPVKRAVAVKVIKAGMDSKAVLARFEAERQALALMDHPNIAKVLDAGATDAGRPFFVMELVKGVPITQFCDKRRLTPRQRLELFVPVCQAIQHAHQKGVIHRDIKPSNVIVALYDDKPVPKVIDFGVAKATGQSLTDKTLMTGFGAVVGTPEYMSPEQASLNNLDVDTRSDVYALGVLLYELLTGTTPVDRKSLGKVALLEVLRIVREVEAPRPSAKLSTADTLPSIAADRGTEPAKLSKLMKGELDWVVLKALEKDRSRRYESANGLARDVERYLAGEAVAAVPPSAGYRLRKFVRRNKGRVVAAGVVLAALVAGIVGTMFGLVRAEGRRTEAETAWAAEAARADGERLAKQEADAKRIEAEREKARAEAGEKLAGERLVQVEAEKRIAQAVRDFLTKKLLGQAEARAQANTLLRVGGLAADVKENPTIRELLDRAAAELMAGKIEAHFPNQPLVQAELLSTVGDTYRGIGEYERAISFLQRAATMKKYHLGVEHVETLVTLNNLAVTYQHAGHMKEALSLLEQVRDAQLRTLGADHPNAVLTLNNLAGAYRASGNWAKAVTVYERARDAAVAKFGADHTNALQIQNNLAGMYREAGRVKDAIALGERVRDARERKFGADHPSTLETLHGLALAYKNDGRPKEAVALLERVRDGRVRALGADSPDTLHTLSGLASAYREVGRVGEAITLFEQVIDSYVQRLGADHPGTLSTRGNLAAAYWSAKRLDMSVPLFEDVLNSTCAVSRGRC